MSILCCNVGVAVTVGALVAAPELGLELVEPGEAEAMSAPVAWIHSSDLPDPSPYLGPGVVLLTTGVQFAAGHDYPAYVARLRQAGVLAVGFGVGVARPRVPEGLVAACRSAGLACFEVPHRLPFIAVIRWNADRIAEAEYAEATWSARALRAISQAALRPDGLTATLEEVAAQLGGEATLYDASGDRVAGAQEAVPDAEVADAVARLLAGRAGAASLVRPDPHTGGPVRVVLQAVGNPRRPTGVLVLRGVGAAGGRTGLVVTAVLALATLALERNAALDRVRRRLRTAMLAQLFEGDSAAAAEMIAATWGPVAATDRAVVVLDPGGAAPDALLDELEARGERAGYPVFFAEQEGLVVCVAGGGDEEALHDLVAAQSVAAGASAVDESEPAPFVAAFLRAARAARAGKPGRLTRHEGMERGPLALLDPKEAAVLARTQLLPLVRHDDATGGALLPTLRAWLARNGQGEPAARELGIHRHTLAARLGRIAELLDADLDDAGVRARLWLALEYGGGG